MRISRSLLTSIAMLVALGVPVVAQTASMEGKWVITGKDVVGIAPPSLVAAPDASNVTWSPTGRYVLAVRTSMRLNGQVLQSVMREIQQGTEPKKPSGEIAIVVWSAATQQATEVWKRPIGIGSIDELRWVPGSDVALARVSEDMQPPARPGEPLPPMERRESLLRINAELGSARVVAGIPQMGGVSIDTSPTRPIVLLRCMQIDAQPRPGSDRPRLRQAILPLGENGRPGPPVEIPAGYLLSGVEWSEDGATPYLILQDRAATAEAKKAVFRWYRLDPAIGRVTALPDQPKLFRDRPAATAKATGDLILTSGAVAAKEGQVSQSIKLLWLGAKEKSDLPRALVAADSAFGWLSPAGDAVLYLQSGSAWVAPLFRIDRQAFEEMRDRARRMTALSNGKQLALALLMYSQDFDDKMPAVGQDVSALIGPYVKNDAIFNGFVYTFAGGNLSDYSDPANTEIGYVTGPGGRAVMYLDGHVMWRSDQ